MRNCISIYQQLELKANHMNILTSFLLDCRIISEHYSQYIVWFINSITQMRPGVKELNPLRFWLGFLNASRFSDTTRIIIKGRMGWSCKIMQLSKIWVLLFQPPCANLGASAGIGHVDMTVSIKALQTIWRWEIRIWRPREIQWVDKNWCSDQTGMREY